MHHHDFHAAVVSIHAPVWGRHGPHDQEDQNGPVSIHAPVWGRPAEARTIIATAEFRSTPPCGGDVLALEPGTTRERFDPRPRVGATCVHNFIFHIHTVSIHAPVWGRPA